MLKRRSIFLTIALMTVTPVVLAGCNGREDLRRTQTAELQREHRDKQGD